MFINWLTMCAMVQAGEIKCRHRTGLVSDESEGNNFPPLCDEEGEVFRLESDNVWSVLTVLESYLCSLELNCLGTFICWELLFGVFVSFSFSSCWRVCLLQRDIKPLPFAKKKKRLRHCLHFLLPRREAGHPTWGLDCWGWFSSFPFAT